jgi:hypothetical protein
MSEFSSEAKAAVSLSKLDYLTEIKLMSTVPILYLISDTTESEYCLERDPSEVGLNLGSSITVLCS